VTRLQLCRKKIRKNNCRLAPRDKCCNNAAFNNTFSRTLYESLFSGGSIMEHISIRIVGLSAFLVAASLSPAGAADMAVKAPPIAVPPPFSWTGFYVGGFVGGAAGAQPVSSPDATNPAAVTVGATTFLPGTPAICDGGTPGLKTGCIANYGLGGGPIIGGTAGYNWQFGKIVTGVEGEFGYLHLSSSSVLPFVAGAPCGAAGCPATFSTNVGDWYGTLAARLGVTADIFNPSWSNTVLFYAKGGAAVTRLRAAENIVAAPPFSVGASSFAGASDVWGWVAGAGIEWALDPHLSMKVEYEYLGFNNQSAGGCAILPLGAAGAGGTWCAATSLNGIQTGKLGVNYRF
jgi:outer membrane immunogenic protein